MVSKLFEHKFLMGRGLRSRPSPSGLLEKNLHPTGSIFFGKALSAIPAQSGEGDYQKARKGSGGKVVRRFKLLIFKKMETKAKSNGQANVNTVKADKTPKFVAGNPVNAVSKAEEHKPQEQPKAEETKPQAETPKAEEQPHAEPTKKEIKANLAEEKPAMNLEQTLKLVAELAKKTALRDKYKEYIDKLTGFEQEQKENIDELEDETAFQQCELVITDTKGNRFTTKSPSVIKGTVAFISGRFAERLAEVEAGIVLPA